MRRYLLAAAILMALVSSYLLSAVTGWVGLVIVCAFTFWRLGYRYASRRVDAPPSWT